MRSVRWLLLVAIAVIAVAVFGTYRTQRRRAQANQRAVPPAVPLGTSANAFDWEWGESTPNGKPSIEVHAKRQTVSQDSNRIQLQEVELQIFQKDGKKYDRVRCPEAEMTVSDKKLYAPGEAEITLDVPVKGDPPHPLTSIKAAGINFDSVSGHAVTDKHVSFHFDGGEGTSEGASYDPDSRTLHLDREVRVNMRGKDPQSAPMKVEAGELTYSEKEGVIHLGPWSRLTRADTVINAGASVVKLLDKKIDTVDAVDAKGVDKRSDRNLEYSAANIHVKYTPDHLMEKLNGAGNARLVSHGKGSDTTMLGDTVDLFFNTETGESELASAVAHGHGSIESKPVPDPKGMTPDTKVMKSETLNLFMKPGGKDLSRVTTNAAGTLEFLPNQAARHRRLLKADQMDVAYGDKNEVQSFHAVNAATETYPSEEERKRKKTGLETAYTSSKVMDASFDEKGEIKTMKQTDNFRYSEGARKAQSDFATLDNATNVMNLENHARISDDTGTTIADHIQLQQSTGDFDAKGHVSTTRLPDAKKTSSDMLDKDEPTRGMADHVISAERNHLIHYIGNAVLWQSSNRIQADKIDVDRDKKSILADGNVVSQFLDNKKDDDGKPVAPAGTPVFTIVKAPHMVYTDADRTALYTGGTDFWRPTLTVKCLTLKAWLNDNNSDADSRLNHAVGDGKVDIVQIAKDRKRVGTGEHAEYYTDEGKIVLTGGEPKLDDSLKGQTVADKLTYFTDDDRLLLEGAPKKQVRTHLLRKKRT
ncbi:MAG TPA: LPS export ABC transporter periplasmic protein LptC [Bryobacteraceae bacterium]|nr:LPS export ABC transporter periplasmic protein LptC [Bryobacteraceae bacterium]